MEKNIKNYMPLYFGCELEIISGDYKHFISPVLTGLHNDIVYFEQTGLSGQTFYGNCHRDNVRLKLRPLSDMTKEQKIKAADLFGWGHHGDDIYKVNQIDGLFESNGYYNKVTNITGSSWNKVISYLRSTGVDMDGLIDAGLAIYKTKL